MTVLHIDSNSINSQMSAMSLGDKNDKDKQ